MTTQIPLATPPGSIRSPSPVMDPPTTDPVPPKHGRKLSNPLKKSVPFPGGPAGPAPAPATSPSADEPSRPRYHSTVSNINIPRSESTNFAGKLKSLRKKIENELSRKRPGSGGPQSHKQRMTKKAQKGTVAGLRPSPALTVPESMSVADASQLCAAKRTDCVLVVDDEEGLSGIFTAKDLAFRVSRV